MPPISRAEGGQLQAPVRPRAEEARVYARIDTLVSKSIRRYRFCHASFRQDRPILGRVG